MAYSASPVHAAGSCTTTSGTTTCTFSPTGSEDTFVVPAGVSTIYVVATGAPGAVGFFGGSAGRGAQVSGDLTVTPGQTLYVNVGGTPTNVAGTCFENVACIGGFNGGGSSLYAFGGRGGGGGGASDVRTVATPSSGDQSESLNSRLIVAGGGGGSGQGRGVASTTPPPQEVPAAMRDRTAAMVRRVHRRPEAQAGTRVARARAARGAAPRARAGRWGSAATAEVTSVAVASVAVAAAATTAVAAAGVSNRPVSAAGGGGGGSNLVPTGGTATIATTIGPSITISYTVPDNTAPSITAPPNITVEATGTDGAAVEFGTDEANGCSATDNADPQPVISYDPQSGSTFPIGTTPVTCTATDSSGNFATATFSVTVEDTAAPKVISTSPRDGGEVGPAANIRATFSEEMQSASVINAFKLFKKGSTNRIAAQVSYDAMTDTATLNPTTNLRRGATYKAVVSTVAEDEAGNRLDQNGSKGRLTAEGVVLRDRQLETH